MALFEQRAEVLRQFFLQQIAHLDLVGNRVFQVVYQLVDKHFPVLSSFLLFLDGAEKIDNEEDKQDRDDNCDDDLSGCRFCEEYGRVIVCGIQGVGGYVSERSAIFGILRHCFVRWREGVDNLSEAVQDSELQMGHINLHGVLFHFGIFVEVFECPFSDVSCVIEASYGDFPDFVFFVQLFPDYLVVDDEGEFVC